MPLLVLQNFFGGPKGFHIQKKVERHWSTVNYSGWLNGVTMKPDSLNQIIPLTDRHFACLTVPRPKRPWTP